jgi:hypothetical protein
VKHLSLLGVSCIVLMAPLAAQAQSIEARIDAIVAGPPAVHAGLGVTTPLGTYVRAGMVGAVGASNDGLSGRLDAIARFHLDPFRQHKWAAYAGGGLTARFDEDRTTRYFLLILAGVDGPVSHGMSTSFEAGLGGGGRIGVILRQAKAERR